jgi:hypothetical protein
MGSKSLLPEPREVSAFPPFMAWDRIRISNDSFMFNSFLIMKRKESQ